jgi:hypothetical protein
VRATNAFDYLIPFVKLTSFSNSYYSAYINYFDKYIEEKGVNATLEDLVFSRAANVSADGKHPWMFNRFISTLFHPIIHAAYGLEFGMSGVIVEGQSFRET